MLERIVNWFIIIAGTAFIGWACVSRGIEFFF